jgi:hypothetical protein
MLFTKLKIRKQMKSRKAHHCGEHVITAYHPDVYFKDNIFLIIIIYMILIGTIELQPNGQK